MVNIELELISDVNLDQAFCVLARTLATGRRTHRAGAWRTKPVQKHLRHARKHLDLLASGAGGEDHLAHAACRLLMALELRERRAQTRATGLDSAENHERVSADTAFRQRGATANVDLRSYEPPAPFSWGSVSSPRTCRTHTFLAFAARGGSRGLRSAV